MTQRVALAALGALVGLLVIAGIWVTYDVNVKRQQVREHVLWLMAVSEARDEANKEEGPPEAYEGIEPELYHHFASDPPTRNDLDELDRAFRTGDFMLARSLLGAVESSIRRDNAAISSTLGRRWDQTTLLLSLAVGLTIVSLGLLLVRQREAWGRREAEVALRATHSRLMRLGVGIVGLDDDGHPQLANDVVQRFARKFDSVPEWWAELTSEAQLPPRQPCSECGAQTHVGRVPTTFADAERLYELVYGGHVHEAESTPYTVVLVRDVTIARKEETRELIQGRLHSVDDVAEGVAQQLRIPLHGVAMQLRHAASSSEAEPWVAEALDSVQRLEELVDSLQLLQVSNENSRSHIADLCAAAARLAVPLTRGEVVLQVDVVDDVWVDVPAARLTQLLYDLLAESVEACRRDGGRRQVTLRAYQHEETVVVEVLDNRDNEVEHDPASCQLALEQGNALGLSFERTSRPHRTVVSLALPIASAAA